MASRPLVLILAMAALSLIPFALLMVTWFVRISVVLSILRSAIGAPSVPPTQVLTGLALILTLYVMAPTGERMYDAVEPVAGDGRRAPTLASGETVAALETAADSGQGAAARLPPETRRPARPGVVPRPGAEDAHAGRARGGSPTAI